MKQLFKRLKEAIQARVLVAEVDGISFYSVSALEAYLNNKARVEARKGKRPFTFLVPILEYPIVARATNMLEQKGVFDYEVEKGCDFYTVRYYATEQIIVWKKKEGGI